MSSYIRLKILPCAEIYTRCKIKSREVTEPMSYEIVFVWRWTVKIIEKSVPDISHYQVKGRFHLSKKKKEEDRDWVKIYINYNFIVYT